MKTIYYTLFITLTFLYSNILSQEIKDFWENDSIKVQGFIIDGERDGQWSEWYSNGQLKLKGNYSTGILNGVWNYYCEHGYKERTVFWKNDSCTKIITYFPIGEEPYIVMDFPNQISNLDYIDYLKVFKWARNNQLRLLKENNVDPDRLHQYFIKFEFPRNYNHSSLNKDEYIDSLTIYEFFRNEYLIQYCKNLNQPFTFHQLNDQNQSGRMIKKIPNGDFLSLKQEYYSTPPNDLYEEIVFINDTLIYKATQLINGGSHETCINYFPNKNIESEGNYKNGQMDGKWLYYNKNKVIIRKETYKNGVLVKSKVID